MIGCARNAIKVDALAFADPIAMAIVTATQIQANIKLVHFVPKVFVEASVIAMNHV